MNTSGLKTHGGMLVPFTVMWFGDVPDFKVTDPRKLKRCLTERRCGLCGRRMQAEVVFLGGDLCMANRLFTDPAMHAECARYAYTACPFLAGKITAMAPAERHRVGVAVDDMVAAARPKRFGLIFTDGWSMVAYGGNRYIRANAGRTEWL